jgi:disulfide bond formation protein DsbB
MGESQPWWQLAGKSCTAHIRRMMVPRLRFALFLCALLSGLALALAIGSEKFADLVPCPLCLLERWPYRVALVAGLIGMVSPRPIGWLALAVCILAFVADAGLAFVHVGVEQHWWQSPLPECQAPNFTGMTAAERFAHMPDLPSKSCEDATYLIPLLPVSMAALNMIFALGLAAGFTRFALFHARIRR